MMKGISSQTENYFFAIENTLTDKGGWWIEFLLWLFGFNGNFKEII